ncbi:ribonuclease Z [Anseongella ginsenosidimutans]|uniref:Ribonuclease Z n=1 Tax=Anseongella ginsenosidimutans TaxID=496056 RepID=A0A4R3KT89_9SPHI|nr:ribonuclease Z [Anseongella ginsenosidimutans]QEC53334.1 ribonuclease Z [Anseongella ginsenosidimutans]TCS88217.1 ribonuclease Z [Anseongella ginsenosidimutans]
MKFQLTILGSSSATPVRNRFPSSQLLNINEKLFLIDCGEATQIQLLRYGLKASRIDHIFISHMHGDHYFGLPGLLSTLHLNGRVKPLYLYGPPELMEIISLTLTHSQTRLRYPLEFYPVDPSEPGQIFENAEITVETIIMNHRIPCTGFLFREKARLPNIAREKIQEYEIPTQAIADIKQGADFTLPNGILIPNRELTIPPRPSRAFAYCADTLVKPDIVSQIKTVDLLYHEATFMNEMLDRANETFHSTAAQAAAIALEAKVKKLVIGHFSARYRELSPLLTEARAVFPATELAKEGTVFQVGEPASS